MKNLLGFLINLGFLLAVGGYMMVFVLKINLFIANLLLIPPGVLLYRHYRKSKDANEEDVTPE